MQPNNSSIQNPLAWGPERFTGLPVLVSPPLNPIKGMDISHYEPSINWPRVTVEGIGFCFAKATDGLGSKDSCFDSHRKACAERHLPFGAYHFLRFGGFSAEMEASLFLKHTGGVRSGELPFTVDVEWDKKSARYSEGTMDEAAALEALELLERLEEATRMTPILYTSYPFFRGFKHAERFFRFHPWLAAYNNQGPKVPLPWSRWAFWQWTDKHPMAKEITGGRDLDGDYFSGTRADLDALRKP